MFQNFARFKLKYIQKKKRKQHDKQTHISRHYLNPAGFLGEAGGELDAGL
jgi:hypothetical protein